MWNALVENVYLQVLHFDSRNLRYFLKRHFQEWLIERKRVKIIINHLCTNKVLHKFENILYQVPFSLDGPIYYCFEQICEVTLGINIRIIEHLDSLHNFRGITTVDHHVLRSVNLLSQYSVFSMDLKILQNLLLILG